MSENVAATRVANHAAQGGVLVKLIIFSVSLAVVPITTYFASQKYIWDGNSTFAAISAVFAANVVLVAYIVLSVLDDKPEPLKPGVASVGGNESRKER